MSLSLPSKDHGHQPPNNDGQSTRQGMTWTRTQLTTLYEACAPRHCVRCERLIAVGKVHTQDERGQAVCTHCVPLYGRPPRLQAPQSHPCERGHKPELWGNHRRVRCVRCGQVWMDGFGGTERTRQPGKPETGGEDRR